MSEEIERTLQHSPFIKGIFRQLDVMHRHCDEMHRRLTRLEKQGMATQAQIDAETSAVNALDQELKDTAVSLKTGFDALEKEIADLKANNPGVDVTATEAAITALKADVDGLHDAVIPPTPAPGA